MTNPYMHGLSFSCMICWLSGYWSYLGNEWLCRSLVLILRLPCISNVTSSLEPNGYSSSYLSFLVMDYETKNPNPMSMLVWAKHLKVALLLVSYTDVWFPSTSALSKFISPSLSGNFLNG